MTNIILTTEKLLHKAIFTFLIVLFFVAKVQAQTLYSAAVDGLTGNITVGWNDTTPALTSNYTLWWGKVAGTWEDSTIFTTPATNTYTTINVNGNTDRYFFRLQIKLISDSTIITDFSTIFLSVNHIGGIIGAATTAVLNWNPVAPTLQGNFLVERYETPAWKMVKQIPWTATTSTYTCNDTISSPFCDTYWNVSYRIRFAITNAVFPESLSNVGSNEPFRDNTLPNNTRNDTVSVYHDPSGKFTGCPVIGWLPSPSNDIAGYEIQRSDLPSSGYFPIDTMPAGTTYYIDTAVVACSKSYAYAIVAIDQCGNRSSGTYVIGERQSITLHLSEINPCDKKANLSWNMYIDMPGGLEGYNVYRKEDNNPYQQIYIAGSTVTSYSDDYNFKNGSTYTYFVRAYALTGSCSSSSCEQAVYYSGQVNPDTLYITQASVEADSYVKINYHFTPENTVKKLMLLRTDTPGGTWMAIDSVTATDGNYLQQDSFFNDTTADVHNFSYYYKLAVVDSCNTISLYSVNSACSILLRCEFTQSENSVLWNPFEIWLKGVNTYEVYRQVDGQPLGGDLVSNTGTNMFVEPSADFAPDAKVCYWVVARENSGNPFVSDAQSVSNSCCIIKAMTVDMPNAFRPEGTNNRFRPKSNIIETGSFKMVIFNKWGQELFVTNDPFLGWDGRINGEPAPFGIYAYLIRYRSIAGESYEKRGTVVLVR